MIEGEKTIHNPTGRKRYLTPDEMAEWAPNHQRMKILTCHFHPAIIEKMHEGVEKGYFPNRSELQRYAVLCLLKEYGLLP